MRILIPVWLFFYSCGGETIPKGIFAPEKMESVLYDIIRADELVDFSVIIDSTYRLSSKRYALYDSIFHLHNITKEEFSKSYNYYQGRPDLLREILEGLHTKSDTVNKKDTIQRRRPGKERLNPQ